MKIILHEITIIPSSVFINTGGNGIVEVTGISVLDTLELLEYVLGLNCLTCDDDSVMASPPSNTDTPEENSPGTDGSIEG